MAEPTDPSSLISWPRLLQGTLLERYKRFMADVKLRNGHVVTAHCPNSGSMKACSEPGRTVYLSRHDNPRRRLKYTWEMIRMPTSLVGINTLLPNRLIRKAVESDRIPGLEGYESLRTEVPYGNRSRVDLLLEGDRGKCFVEIKNCTLVEDGTALFPDAVTSRGLKHLVELREQVRRGHRAVLFYLVQRMDADRFSPADRIDPAYGKELREAVRRGVEIFCYDVRLDLEGIDMGRALPCVL